MPGNRFPVQTKLLSYSKDTVRNAILHELERGVDKFILFIIELNH
ncbi:MAG: hypothetical protein U0354_09100 [Candidatus Sericytochromatia bacterium]